MKTAEQRLAEVAKRLRGEIRAIAIVAKWYQGRNKATVSTTYVVGDLNKHVRHLISLATFAETDDA